jgi:hypothetical protein
VDERVVARIESSPVPVTSSILLVRPTRSADTKLGGREERERENIESCVIIEVHSKFKLVIDDVDAEMNLPNKQ